MLILITLAALIVGGLLNLAKKPNVRFVYNLAACYLYLALLLSAGYWVFYFAGIRAAIAATAISWFLRPGAIAGNLILGYLLIYILFDIQPDADPDKYPAAKINRFTLWGLSILCANTFLLATVGKAENFKEMAAFFTTSGYAIWFLYFIMVAESLGAVGILLHFKLKTGPIAAAGLMLIMIGALYTHCHNKDPFSDSYAAVYQFIVLSLLQVAYYIERHEGTGAAHHNRIIV